MFESRSRLTEEIQGLLKSIREVAEARYACLIEPGRILFEDYADDESDIWALRRLLQDKGTTLFSIPRALAANESPSDVFADWDQDEFFLAFVNGRIALVVACQQAAPLETTLYRPLRALTDRLLRFNELYRLDPQGRGFFFGHPRLDLVVVGRANPED